MDISLLQTWVGRRREEAAVIEGSSTAALAATLDHADAPEPGASLPPLWHWLYFTPRTRQSELGADGHPRLGDFMPPIPLTRRMWAGGRLRFGAPILIGETVRRETEIQSITHKSGGQGDLVFVTLRHRLHTDRGLAIDEEQDLVYRAPSQSAEITARDPALAREPAQWREALTPDPVLLFRYSALTFNAHRIHYDALYAKSEEGYPGLVVQGPLTATLLVDRLLARTEGRLAEFSFRGVRPLFADAPLSLCGEGGEARGEYRLWAETPDGSTAMSATARTQIGWTRDLESPEVGLPMPDQPSFPGFERQPPLPATDRLFLGVFLERDAAARGVDLARRLRKDLNLRGMPLAAERLHITLHHIGDYAGLPPRVIAAIRDAAATVRMDPFEVEFDRVASFSGRPGNRPLVLRGGDGLAELMKFQRGLSVAITRARVGRPVASQFTPHVTLLYDDIQVEELAVEPIRWIVREFILVHSLLGQTRHVPLARWSLGG